MDLAQPSGSTYFKTLTPRPAGFLDDDPWFNHRCHSASLASARLPGIHSHRAGLERLRELYVKHLEGRLWEMRMKGKDGIARAAYVTAAGRCQVERDTSLAVPLAPAASWSWQPVPAKRSAQ